MPVDRRGCGGCEFAVAAAAFASSPRWCHCAEDAVAVQGGGDAEGVVEAGLADGADFADGDGGSGGSVVVPVGVERGGGVVEAGGVSEPCVRLGVGFGRHWPVKVVAALGEVNDLAGQKPTVSLSVSLSASSSA